MTKNNDENLSAAEIAAGLKKLEDAAGKNVSPAARMQSLLAKSLAGQATVEEKEELLKGVTGTTTGLADQATQNFRQNEDLNKAFDASDFLKAQSDELVKSVTVLASAIDRGLVDGRQWNEAAGTILVGMAKGYGAMAKSLADTQDLVKGIAERVGTIARTPASQPRALQPGQNPQMLQKSFQDGSGQPQGQGGIAGTGLSKADCLNAIDEMIQKGLRENEFGEQLAMATAKLEQSQGITPTMLQTIQKFRQQNQGGQRAN